MEIAQGYARRPKRIYAVEKCGFFHFVITMGYPFCTNFLQTFIMKKAHLLSYFAVLRWFLIYVSLKEIFFLFCKVKNASETSLDILKKRLRETYFKNQHRTTK